MKFYNYLENKAKNDGIDNIVVGAVIVNKNNEILIVKRKEDDFMGGFYEIPGGNSEENESIYDTLIREIKEETNLDLSKVVSYIDYFDYLTDGGKKCRQFNFKINVKDGIIILTEHDDYKWLNINEIENIDRMSKEVRNTLLIYRFNELSK